MIGSAPTAAAYAGRLGEVFVAHVGSNTVSASNDTTDLVTATIPLGGFACGIAYDRGAQATFVARTSL